MTPGARTEAGLLRSLARLYGVQTVYYDVARQRREATPEALLRVLAALGAPLATFRDVPAALRERRQDLWRRTVEPVVVAWEGGPATLPLRLPVDGLRGAASCQLSLESGETRRWTFALARLSPLQSAEVEGVRYVAGGLPIPGGLPWGYHRLTLEMKGERFETALISAPEKAYPSPGEASPGAWGVFSPLYALHSRRSWGAGDLADLEALMAWVSELGGTVVATLPFLAADATGSPGPSPYAPVSRLFWDESYIDVASAPGLQQCPEAQALLGAPDVQRELEALRSAPLVDYRRQGGLKRRVLEALARCFFAPGPEYPGALRHFVEATPAIEDYARFRATGEGRGTPWTAWPAPQRDGVLRPGDYDEETKRYHLYVQWLAHGQLLALSEGARRREQELYLDLPLGVHPHGYDVWRERQAFAAGVSVGAPPDTFVPKGQNWGFPPLHPERIREQAYRYPIAYLRHHLQYARLLRVDHVMGLHRLFWVPDGMEAREGVYVRYPAEELYALLSLESHRGRARIVGENLGTGTVVVNAAMRRHNIHGMYVVQRQVRPDPRMALGAVPRASVASLNTHDMPPFAAFWGELDIEQRLQLGLLGRADADAQREERQALRSALLHFLARQGWLDRPADDARAVLRGCLGYLAASRARLVLVNLEDLWLEVEPQNVPGTWREYPNWRRKARYRLEELRQLPEVEETLREVARLRQRKRRVTRKRG